MGSYDSPLGSRKVTSAPLREFDIPDEAEEDQVVRRTTRNFSSSTPVYDEAAMREFQSRADQQEEPDAAEVERQIKAARDSRRSGKERLNDGAKRRIEMLLGMTRTVHRVDFGDNKSFGLHTLKSKEMREAIMVSAEFDGTVQGPFEIRKQLLARSIFEVSGIGIDQFVGSDSMDVKLAFIDELDESLLNKLYGEYFKLVAESKEKFSIKTDEDAKEVIEDLKKS